MQSFSEFILLLKCVGKISGISFDDVAILINSSINVEDLSLHLKSESDIMIENCVRFRKKERK